MIAQNPPSDLGDLIPDCAACAGLCCVTPAFDKGADFALDKPALTPCRHLDPANLCCIHDTLADQGFSGCVQFDCLGAGQRVTQDLFAGTNWRETPEVLPAMADAFRTLRRVHEALQSMFVAAALPLPAKAEAARLAMIVALAPPAGWTPAALARAETDGLFRQLRDTLALFREAASGAPLAAPGSGA